MYQKKNLKKKLLHININKSNNKIKNDKKNTRNENIERN